MIYNISKIHFIIYSSQNITRCRVLGYLCVLSAIQFVRHGADDSDDDGYNDDGDDDDIIPGYMTYVVNPIRVQS